MQGRPITETPRLFDYNVEEEEEQVEEKEKGESVMEEEEGRKLKQTNKQRQAGCSIG